MSSLRAPTTEGTIKARVVKGAFDEDRERSPVLAERSPAVALDGPGYGQASSTMESRGGRPDQKGSLTPFLVWAGP
jgi:hypothetical protein